MIGPKLDARSYTNLILVVIAILLALNLVAQQPSRPTAFYTGDSEAIQQVALSVNQVAAANQQVAASLNRVADSISGASEKLAEALQQRSGMAPQSAPPSQPSGTIDVNPPGYQGKVELNQ